MNIPIATITDTNVDTAIILDDNSNNMIHINTEATQIINQMAFLEVSQHYDSFSETQISQNMERGGNYDRDTLRINFSISSSSNRSLSLPSSRIYNFYHSSSSPTSRIINNNLPDNNYEGKVIFYFFLLFILMIIILNKTL